MQIEARGSIKLARQRFDKIYMFVSRIFANNIYFLERFQEIPVSFTALFAKWGGAHNFPCYEIIEQQLHDNVKKTLCSFRFSVCSNIINLSHFSLVNVQSILTADHLYHILSVPQILKRDRVQGNWGKGRDFSIW